LKIYPIEVVEYGDQIKIQSLIEYAGKQEVVWYSVDNKYQHCITRDKLDCFLVGLLLLAMRRKEDVVLKGKISEKLFYNITYYYMDIICLLMPSLTKIDIIPESLDDGKEAFCEGAVGTGFSAGVDSFCTAYDHLIREVPNNFKLTHFTFHNVGAHDSYPYSREKTIDIFNDRYELAKEFPNNMGIDFIKIDSNISEVLNWGNFAQVHVPSNISAVLVLQKLFGKFYYSSAYRYQDSFIGEVKKIARVDPIAETLDFIASGSQYSRVEKTEIISSLKEATQLLNVCINTQTDGLNCSLCWKCCKTLITLEMLGKLEQYNKVFDLSRWQEVRKEYIAKNILGNTNDDPFIREIKEFARKVNYSFS